MKGLLANFRQSRHVQSGNQMILRVSGYDDKVKAKELIGKKVTWKSPAGKEINGKVTLTHGNKGAVRVHFETGMPGQSVASQVDVV